MGCRNPKRTDYEPSSQKESASCSRKVVCSTISVRWEPPQIHRLQASRREWKIQEKKLIRSGEWSQIESPNGAAPIPDSQLSPYPPHSSSLFSKLGIPIHPLVGLISITSVLGIHPALTNTARMRELICCAPVIGVLSARLSTRYFVQ